MSWVVTVKIAVFWGVRMWSGTLLDILEEPVIPVPEDGGSRILWAVGNFTVHITAMRISKLMQNLNFELLFRWIMCFRGLKSSCHLVACYSLFWTDCMHVLWQHIDGQTRWCRGNAWIIFGRCSVQTCVFRGFLQFQQILVSTSTGPWPLPSKSFLVHCAIKSLSYSAAS
jgi:hypothetical protein